MIDADEQMCVLYKKIVTHGLSLPLSGLEGQEGVRGTRNGHGYRASALHALARRSTRARGALSCLFPNRRRSAGDDSIVSLVKK